MRSVILLIVGLGFIFFHSSPCVAQFENLTSRNGKAWNERSSNGMRLMQLRVSKVLDDDGDGENDTILGQLRIRKRKRDDKSKKLILTYPQAGDFSADINAKKDRAEFQSSGVGTLTIHDTTANTSTQGPVKVRVSGYYYEGAAACDGSRPNDRVFLFVVMSQASGTTTFKGFFNSGCDPDDDNLNEGCCCSCCCP